MNERTHIFIKIYLSHFTLERVHVGCVWEGGVGDGDRLLHIDPSSSDHSSTSFSSWLGLLNRGSLRAQSPLSAAGSYFGIFSPTDSNSNWNWPKLSVVPGYISVLRTPASAVPPLIYTGASLDWRLGRGSIYNMWTGALSWWKCHWPDLKSAGLFPRNLFLNSLKTST